MFRRKTDQVYATLQKVQRSLSQVNEDSQSASSRSRRSTGKVPKSSPIQPQVSEEVMRSFTQSRQDALIQTARRVTEDLQSDSPSDHVALSTGGADAQRLAAAKLAKRQGAIQLSWASLGTVSSLILILWVASLVLVWEIAAGYRHSRPPETTQPPTASHSSNSSSSSSSNDRPRITTNTAPPNVPPITAPTAGDNLKFIVLESVGAYSRSSEDVFRGRADELNEISKGIEGIAPYFGVRRPQGNGLQLIYGETAPKTYGIPAAEAQKLLPIMRASGDKGPGYSDAYIP